MGFILEEIQQIGQTLILSFFFRFLVYEAAENFKKADKVNSVC
jgi:hypothetical protein